MLKGENGHKNEIPYLLDPVLEIVWSGEAGDVDFFPGPGSNGLPDADCH